MILCEGQGSAPISKLYLLILLQGLCLGATRFSMGGSNGPSGSGNALEATFFISAALVFGALRYPVSLVVAQVVVASAGWLCAWSSGGGDGDTGGLQLVGQCVS